MKLHILTIVLDGMPFLLSQLSVFNRVRDDWHWHIVEGTALPVKDTAWCKRIEPRLSKDGTTELLEQFKAHPRITVHQRASWEGKTAMVNHALQYMREPGVLLQVDMDEIWTSYQIEDIVAIFGQQPTVDCAKFYCRYYVGPNLVTVGDDCYGNNSYEWMRAWRFIPGMYFVSHEPPKLAGIDDQRRCLPREKTALLFLTFEHYAYVYEAQVRFKEQYYDYPGAVAQWRKLQQNKIWPAQLKAFLPWVDDRAQVTQQ